MNPRTAIPIGLAGSLILGAGIYFGFRSRGPEIPAFSGPGPDAPVEELVAQGNALFHAGHYEQAAPLLARALSRNPHLPEAAAHLGGSLYFLGQPDGALEQLDRAILLDPEFPEPYFYKGLVLARGLNRPDEASQAWEQFLALIPDGQDAERVRTWLAELDSGSAEEISPAAPLPILEPTVETRPILPAATFGGSVRKAYQAAGAIPGILDRIHCYCECQENLGHKTLLTCYTSTHASVCDICLGEALMAYELYRGGKSAEEIVARVDEHYRKYGKYH